MLRRTIATLLMLPPAFAWSAGNGDVTLGAYAEDVRARVAAKMHEALGTEAPEDAVSGIVTYAGETCAFLQGASDALKIDFTSAKGRERPQAGDAVRITGRPTLEGGRVVFAASGWQKSGTAALPAARTVDSADLSFVPEGAKDRARDVNGKRVAFEGRAIGTTENGYAVKVEDLPVTVIADEPPAFLEDCEAMQPKVRVTGVAELILDQSALVGKNRYVMGVRVFAKGGDVILEPDVTYLMNRRDARVRRAVIAAFALLALVLVAVIVFAVRGARRQLRTKTVMMERKRMADDLHDTIEQHLVGAGMLLQLGRTKEAREILLNAKREMRDIVWGLKNDDMMRLTPAEMIREYAREETRKGICRIDVRLAGLPGKMESAAMRDLSLIIREAVGNAIKHGDAKKVAITCDALGERDGWHLRIANDGKPFDPAKAPGASEGHFGVEGMKARARRLNAELAYEMRGAWTVVSLRCEKRI